MLVVTRVGNGGVGTEVCSLKSLGNSADRGSFSTHISMTTAAEGLPASVECSGWAVTHSTSPYNPLARTCQMASFNFKGTEKSNSPMNQKAINTRNACHTGGGGGGGI